MLTLFTTDELIDWESFETKFGNYLVTTSPGILMFPQDGSGELRWTHIKERIIGHVSRLCLSSSGIVLVLLVIDYCSQ